MTVALLTNIVSPHQLPLACEIVGLIGANNYIYAYTEPFHRERAKMGWGDGSAPEWCRPASECKNFLNTADLVYSELRDIELFEERLFAGKKSFYVSERWFKPINLPFGLSLPGCLKLLYPKYFKMAKRFARLFRYSGFRYLPQGPWAEKDMKAICRLFRQKYDERQFASWGYFVAPSSRKGTQRTFDGNHVRVLWVGRMLPLKRVDTIIKAISSLPKDQFTLTLVGNGIDEARLKHLAVRASNIKFRNSVGIAEVRSVMRDNDVYVFASDSNDGWGAVVNEALEEGMLVLGTFETGASATMLPKTHLFHAGDWRALSRLLAKAANGEIEPTGIGDWTAKAAAKRLLNLAE